MKQFIKKHFPSVVVLKYLRTFARHPWFLKDFNAYRRNVKDGGIKPVLNEIYPVVKDKTTTTGFDTHYIYHPAWAARIIQRTHPQKHVDISSTLHFCTQLSAFIPTEFYDYRPASLNLSNLVSGSADLSNLHFKDDSIESLSCMHTVEHVGLGRYGDPVDPGGDVKAIKELQRVLKVNGNLLFVTPVGKPRIIFNMHRIYSYEQVCSLFNELQLVEFSLIPDDAETKGMIMNADPALVALQQYGCGCFWFTKKK